MNEEQKKSITEFSQGELFERVNEICAGVNQALDEKELLEFSLKEIMSLYHASRGSIFLLDEKGENLILVSSQGMKVDEQNRITKRMGQGIVGQVAQKKEPFVVDDISQDQRFNNFKARGSYKTPSFICAPLLFKDTLLGVINITDKTNNTRFRIEELQMLDFLTSQIALNYRRIGLYNKFKMMVQETMDLKDKLGQTHQETSKLKKQIINQEKLASIGKLAGGIAHEFNNPLDGVMRYTNLCLEHTKEDDVVRGYLLEIKQGLNRMANIVKNLLACSRNETHNMTEKVSVKDIVEHVVYVTRSEINLKNISIRQEIQNNIPLIQDLGIARILSNLLRNAIDAMKNGGEIVINAQSDGQHLYLDVTDTGEGMASEDIEKIFEPFYTTKDIDKGCGLGLTVVSEIVKSYRGKISVMSEPHKGTTFSINLPIQ